MLVEGFLPGFQNRMESTEVRGMRIEPCVQIFRFDLDDDAVMARRSNLRWWIISDGGKREQVGFTITCPT